MTPIQNRGLSNNALATLFRTVSILITAAALIGTTALPRAADAGEIPTFAVDASWPKPLPNNWILGQVGGITVDRAMSIPPRSIQESASRNSS
jgi:hypothetical protein